MSAKATSGNIHRGVKRRKLDGKLEKIRKLRFMYMPRVGIRKFPGISFLFHLHILHLFIVLLFIPTTGVA